MLPVISVPGLLLFPGTYITLQVGDAALLSQFDVATRHHGGYLCVAMVDPYGDRHGLPPHHEPLHGIGCLAEVRERTHTAQGDRVRLGGLERLTLILDLETTAGRYVRAVFQEDEERDTVTADPEILQALRHALLELPDLPSFVLGACETMPFALWLDAVAFHLPVAAEERQVLLAMDRCADRARHILSLAGAASSTARRPRPDHLN